MYGKRAAVLYSSDVFSTARVGLGVGLMGKLGHAWVVYGGWCKDASGFAGWVCMGEYK